MKHIEIVTPTYNELENIEVLVERIHNVFKKLKDYTYSILIIDNYSVDGTREKIRDLCRENINIRAIFNSRNFGHIRSPYHGILNSEGDATIYLASDLQDPPEYIEQLIDKWEKGAQVVMAVKPVSHTGFVIHRLRKFYYRLLNKISTVELLNDSTGFGLYDKSAIELLNKYKDPYPYLRGLIIELGLKVETIQFEQPRRFGGVTKNNFYTLYDIAMLGMVSHSMVPIRIASFMGFGLGLLTFIFGLIIFALKMFYWESFPIGIAPLLIITSLLFSALFIFIGILGEYIGSIHNYVRNRPIVIEEERING